jgi:probable F420-dependent oxidoreductase
MRVSVGLPVHRVDLSDEFVSAQAIGELAAGAESAGFDAVFVTDHPFPGDEWLARGGHHALDPFVALSFAAATTTTLRLHTNLLVVAYRNPWLAAKAVATLDRLSGGRVLLGIGAGYLQSEFDALGVEFATRNDRTDEAIRAMRRAWSGESVDGNTMLPTPAQAGGPPIWIGGNSKRALRRAVELGDGWSPFPNPARAARVTRTPPLETVDDLRGMLRYAQEHAEAVGRTAPLEVAFMPLALTMLTAGARWEADRVVEEAEALRSAGVTYLVVNLPGDSRSELGDDISRFGEEVITRLATA